MCNHVIIEALLLLGDTSAREGVSESANEVAFVSLLQSPLHGLKRRPKTSALLALKGVHLHSTSLVNKWPLNTRARSALLPMCKIGGGHAFLPHPSVCPPVTVIFSFDAAIDES